MAAEWKPDDFAWRGDDTIPGASAAPVSLRRSLLLALSSVAALAAVAMLALLALGGGGTSAPTPVSLAADVTQRTGGFRFTLDVDASVAGQRYAISAHGAINERPTPNGSMSMTIAGHTVDELLLFPNVYVDVPGTSARWIRLNLASFQHSLGASSIGSSDPSQFVGFLRAAGSVALVGDETIDGVATTRYRALVDLGRYAAVVPAMARPAAEQAATALERLTGGSTRPIEAWVDARGRLRRVTVSLRSVCTKAGPLSETVTMDYLGYGPQPAVSAPPADQVTDLSAQSAALGGASTAQLGC